MSSMCCTSFTRPTFSCSCHDPHRIPIITASARRVADCDGAGRGRDINPAGSEEPESDERFLIGSEERIISLNLSGSLRQLFHYQC
jgi:hypothetical protein